MMSTKNCSKRLLLTGLFHTLILMIGKNKKPEDLLESLSSSYDGVLVLERMMKSNEPGLKIRGAGQSAAGASDERELQSMMRDPKYWRDKDPSFVAKVTEGFERLYSGR